MHSKSLKTHKRKRATITSSSKPPVECLILKIDDCWHIYLAPASSSHESSIADEHGMPTPQCLAYGGGLIGTPESISWPSLKLMDAIPWRLWYNRVSCSCPRKFRRERSEVCEGSCITWIGISRAKVPWDRPSIFKSNINTYRRADNGLRNVGRKVLLAFTGTVKIEVHGVEEASVTIVPTEESRCKRQGRVSQQRRSANVA